MGHAEFLTGAPDPAGQALANTIEGVRDFSTIFKARWQAGDNDRASEVSLDAFRYVEYIIGECMRHRDDMRDAGTYAGSPFEAAMNIPTAKMARAPSVPALQAILMAGPGNGRIPAGMHSDPISLEKTLNKLKHRVNERLIMTFRFEGDRHIWLVFPGSPSLAVVELDVGEWCDHCLNAAAAM